MFSVVHILQTAWNVKDINGHPSPFPSVSKSSCWCRSQIVVLLAHVLCVIHIFSSTLSVFFCCLGFFLPLRFLILSPPPAYLLRLQQQWLVSSLPHLFHFFHFMLFNLSVSSSASSAGVFLPPALHLVLLPTSIISERRQSTNLVHRDGEQGVIARPYHMQTIFQVIPLSYQSWCSTWVSWCVLSRKCDFNQNGELNHPCYAQVLPQSRPRLWIVSISRNLCELHGRTKSDVKEVLDHFIGLLQFRSTIAFDEFLLPDAHRAVQKYYNSIQHLEVGRADLDDMMWLQKHIERSGIDAWSAHKDPLPFDEDAYPGLRALTARQVDILSSKNIKLPTSSTHVIDLSQSFGRASISREGLCNTLTPKGSFFLTDRCRMRLPLLHSYYNLHLYKLYYSSIMRWKLY